MTRPSMPIRNVLLCITVLTTVGAFWFHRVSNTVPEPYLDELFHVRQAKAYREGRWDVWDPKITTPPGLYAISYAWLWLLDLLCIPGTILARLRAVNLFLGVPGIFWVSRRLLRLIPQNELENAPQDDSTAIDHSALNLVLFPLLFFFSALFYTDVLSIFFVVQAYACFHQDQTIGMLLCSLVALTFRQTNIFWTAIYLGGLQALKTLHGTTSAGITSDGTGLVSIISTSWQKGSLYDPTVAEASFGDYFKAGVSLGVAFVARLGLLTRRLGPHLCLLASFGVFVLWNGGIVLGDKSNHVASLNLPQMLYLWAYITFFSFPILLPVVLASISTWFVPSTLARKIAPRPPRMTIVLAFLVLSIAAVHYNTVIHPFILADNRHYTFYVFRILRLTPVLKYLAAPIYLCCGWAVITALGGVSSFEPSPVSISSTKTSTGRDATAPVLKTRTTYRIKRAQGNRVSFVLVWLVASAGGLIAAPLVEPRYFILPWFMWRLHVRQIPASSAIIRSEAAKEHDDTMTDTENLGIRSSQKLAAHALWIETLWFLLLNLGTAYMFLHRDFEWKQEPGVTQRFMW